MCQKYVNFSPLYISLKIRLIYKMFFGVILRQILKKNRFNSSCTFWHTVTLKLVFDDSFVKFDIVEHNMKIFFKYSTIYPMQ